VYFDLKDTTLQLSAQGVDLGSAVEDLEVAYNGTLERIAFPTRNLLEILSHYISDRIEMLLTGPEGPCGIHGMDDIDYTVIIMPMKVSESAYYTEEE
jgi:DNA polymerase-3 subunit beta